MKIFPLSILFVWLLPNVLQADPDAERSVEAAKMVNAFAAAHHRLLPAGNVLTSPWSIETNMAMVYAGAEGQTREAMRKAFFFPQDDRLHPAFQSLRQSLLARPAVDVGDHLRVANRLFYAQNLALLPGWLTITRTHYAAEAAPLDFHTDPDAAGKVINQWASDQTAGKIPAIIPDGALDPLVLVVLVNAVYFDLPWDERFTKELTQDQPFHINATQIKTVPLMFKQHRLGYARKEGFQIAALPYAGGTFQFVVILPDAIDGLARVEKAITGELLSECAKLQPTEVRLSFPRIRLEPPIVSLKRSLTALGAGVMFDEPPGANFSRMVQKSVYVSEVFHRTYLELDEEGTKAAAATATIIRPRNGVPHEVPHEAVKADHPFIFMIQHVPSGACLFLGRLTDPAPGAAAVVGTAPAKK